VLKAPLPRLSSRSIKDQDVMVMGQSLPLYEKPNSN
jgi:hypothetical protein